MTKRNLFGWTLFSAALAIPGAALAAPPGSGCAVTVQQLGDAHIAPYNALLRSEYVEPIRLRLWNRGDAACSGTLTIRNSFGEAELVRAQGGKLNYVIVDEHNRSFVIFDPVANDPQPIPVTIPANRSIDVQPRFVVPGGQAGRAGRYASMLEARFREDGEVTDELGDVSLAVNVQPSAQANFVGYGDNATLDLGELTPGKSDSIGLQVRASADVDIQVSSEARGKLVQTSGAGIPYSITVQGMPVDLSAPSSLDIALADSVRGQTMPVDVTVGDFENAPVGHYRDVVTFRISAK
jgi:hypothetical protein